MTTAASTGEAPIKPGELVLVTGGGRGVTAAVAQAFARRFRPTLALFGRSPLEDEPYWLSGAETEAEIKRLLLSHADDKLTPKQLGERCAAVLARREIRRNLAAMEQAGARAVYRSVDVCDRKRVEEVVAELQAEFGPVSGLIHGAGVLADRLIVDKTADDFRRVFDTKVVGAENLLDAVGSDDLRLLAFFSSSTARFGRKGQSDYAAANETLNKLAQRERRRRANCRVLSVNWGPWDGGMVDDGLKKLFAAEGVAVIPQIAGAELLADLAEGRGGDAVEIVVLGKGSRTPDHDAAPNAPTAGVDASLGSPVFERDVDVESHPVLRSHIIKGKAVLPAAVMMEWLAHAALVRNPGLAVVGVDDFRVLSGVRLGESDHVRLIAFAGKAQRQGDSFSVRAELRSARDGKTALHAQCSIRLANRLPTSAPHSNISEPEGEEMSVAAAYSEFLFHGPALHAFSEIAAVGPVGASASLRSAPDPADWFDKPIRSRWLTEPLAVDAAFQLAILWSRVNHDAACLPTKIGAYRQFAETNGQSTRLVGILTQTNPNACIGDFEFVGLNGKIVARLEACEFVVDRSLNEAFERPECSAGS
jgi:NAD(P)-dependent dehydrogenase (short-subunit alcohol dehydrogenase family)